MLAANTRYQTPYGSFDLTRYPGRTREPLQAWCAADALLLEEAHKRGISGADTLVINDAHGALCVALQPSALWTDSALAAIAVRNNALANGLAEPALIPSTQTPDFGVKLAVLRIPKALPYLEYQLARLCDCLPEGATVLAAGMDKHLSSRTAEILERYIGPTERHRGQRKARLFSAARTEQPAPSLKTTASYYCTALGADLQGLPNVFSRDKLDNGSRLLLSQLPKLPRANTLIDLACGNGVLGLGALKVGLAEQLLFCDESAMAIASARMNAEQLFGDARASFSFFQGDGLRDYQGGPAQLILCNPPFHLEHTVDEFTGRHLLGQCAQHLSPGGHLCVVANRHLNYLPLLRRSFGRVEQLAGNAKFNVLLAHRT